MASKYDSIKTAKDLVSEVMMHGFSLNQEDICRAQDIFGHSTIEELVDLANDIGRNDENGNPDPKGTWSSGRRGTRSTFYQIAFNIWNWEDATRFWNQHSNPLKEAADIAEAQRRETKKRLDQLNEAHEALRQKAVKLDEDLNKYVQKEFEARAALKEAEAEIIRLKARLFDMMEAQK
ncbi:MAG: hypothetical protein IJI27_08215 [Oscillospiraceae bacterium]|nr:hypothetical protein [Oscillospiraceae bacterium]